MIQYCGKKTSNIVQLLRSQALESLELTGFLHEIPLQAISVHGLSLKSLRLHMRTLPTVPHPTCYIPFLPRKQLEMLNAGCPQLELLGMDMAMHDCALVSATVPFIRLSQGVDRTQRIANGNRIK